VIARCLLAAALLFAACRVTPPAVRVRAPAAAPPAAEQPESAPQRTSEPVGAPVAGDAVSTGLVAVEVRLGRGDLDLALVDLLDLARRHPDDPRVRTRLARVLHQRALLRYGHGSLAGAIHDWERVVELEPGNVCAIDLLATARAESARQTPPAR